jgi:hypothetical protein
MASADDDDDDDDDVITGRSLHIINKVTEEIEEVTNNIGLKINVDKIKCMNTSKYKHKNM